MTLLRIAAVALLAFAAAAVSGVGRPDEATSAAADTTRGITVTGTGKVNATPNRADVFFGVVTDGRTARGALAANAAAARRVIAALRAAGVEERDLQTQQVSITPLFDETARQVSGYQARNTVVARIRELDRAGAAIDSAVEAGANEVYGPTMSVADRAALERGALQAAMADARARAQAIASAGGVSLGRVLTVVEGGGVMPPPMPYAATDRAVAESSTPIEPGTQETQAVVTVTYALQWGWTGGEAAAKRLPLRVF
jgi:uncharacterized protein